MLSLKKTVGLLYTSISRGVTQGVPLPDLGTCSHTVSKPAETISVLRSGDVQPDGAMSCCQRPDADP